MPRKPKAADPDKLVREHPGVYRSEDGRFTVRSDAAGAWYVSDGERANELGLDLVFGPLATLAEAKEAVRHQRDAPSGQTADEAAALAAAAAAAPPPERKGRDRPVKASTGRSRGGQAAEPDAEPEPEPAPPAPAEPPKPVVRQTRRRRTSDARDDVVDALRGINDAWLEGRPDDMAGDLDEQVVVVREGALGRSVGRGRAVAGYREFVTSAAVREFTESDLSIDAWGDTAVASYRYDIGWEADGERHTERGRDLFVFRRVEGTWLAVYRLQRPDPPDPGD
jgi:hypothetical protein